MKILVLLSVLIFAIGVSTADDYEFEVNENDLEMDEDDEDILREIEEKHIVEEMRRENEKARELALKIAEEHYNFPEPNLIPKLIDPCREIHCGAGRICKAEGKEASCICIPECPEETEPRRKVCTNLNETWPSACEVHRQRCLCNTNDPRCKGPEVKHVHIEYYGICRDMPECTEDDMADFPRRMRDWLFNVMRDLASRQELPDTYMELSHEAETNITKRWTNAAIWKWCDLDAAPHDNSVSLHELFPLRAPLMALEQCIAPFLDSCDSNDDHRITLIEWGKCLQVEEEDLHAKCADINPNEPEKDLEAELL